MRFIPEDVPHTLEFSRILEMTAEHCMGTPGRELSLQIRPSTDIHVILQRLREVDEWARTMIGPEPVPFSPYEDIRDTFRYLSVTDYIMEVEDLLHYRNLLYIHRDLHQYPDEETSVAYPVLTDLIQSLPFESEPLDLLEQVFDEKGDIRDTASPALASIRRSRINLQKELDKQFRQLVGQYKKSGWLADSGESIRGGRLVLTVPVEHKRKIKGIIHDESATGKTVFLEPAQLVEGNNDLFELESEERQEIQRILKELSQRIRPYSDYLQDLISHIIRLDLIRAKATVSRMYNGTHPEMTREIRMHLEEAFHPLLWIKNRISGKPVIPFGLDLDPQHRILVLSGPNAGGKSITMKSVLMIQLLAQAGYLVPAKQGSILPVFQKCFADIGDQQSIEDDLSTYSSKLRNMRQFLEHADRRTLIAIDEFGSGTDPKMGGAIAEAILKSLNKKKVFGVVTTHYSNLKIFAFQHAGLINGSMVFDQEELHPTYELRVGQPGSSFAFEIASSSGLPVDVLDYARKRSGTSNQAVDQLLVNLQNDRSRLEEELETIQIKKEKLDQLVSSYEQMFKDLEYQRKKHKMELRELALQQKSRDQQDVDQVIQELKQERNLEKAKEKRELLQAEQEKLRKQVGSIREEVHQISTDMVDTSDAIEVGTFVRIRNGGAIGEILRVEKGKAEIAVGALKMIVDLFDLQAVREPLNIRSRPSISVGNTAQEYGSTRLDLRGFKLEEGRRVLQLFLDQALLSSARRIVILHGKGTGALRKMVLSMAREYKDIKKVGPADPEEGGDGVTVIQF
ncbi:MAG: Smr/MutS family protein [Saprospiraceae bacterium]|nr:Smr/MutS family protein [Saprospiraceae bacterium]